MTIYFSYFEEGKPPKPMITVHDFPYCLTTEALAHLLLIGYFDPPYVTPEIGASQQEH